MTTNCRVQSAVSTFRLAFLAAVALCCGGGEPGNLTPWVAEGDPPGMPQAWVRCAESPQTYAGRPYWWVGEADLRGAFEVPPAPGLQLALLWGSKNDTRTARLTLNDQDIPLSAGGFDGFRWLVVPLSAGLPGDRHELLIRPGIGGREAFIAAFCLLAQVDESAADRANLDARAAAHRATVQAIRRPDASTASQEAFPDMRPFWDRLPAPLPEGATELEKSFRQAEANSRLTAEAFYRCRRYVDGWLAHADPVTGLIPRNLGQDRDLWNGRDAGADNYPFMVLTCALLDRPMFEGRMRDMLRTEERVTRRLDRLGDQYSFSKRGFAYERLDLDRLVFDNAEYVKDGLIPLTEWLGPSPWSERMVGLIEDLWKHAAVETPFGPIPTLVLEVNGDLLQACSRLFWFTGDERFLDWAIRLGDYYLLGNHHPTRDFEQLRFSDHDCEILNGLSELYFAVAQARPEKKRAYEQPMRELLDRVLEIGRNPDGLLWHTVNPKTGTNNGQLCDTWGYNYDAVYTAFLVDGVTAYRDAVRQVLGNLGPKYHGRPWADKSQDGIADSVEGALNLYHREPVPAAADWMDHQIRVMWASQQSDGTIERWHGDGNFARTSIMYALWKSQGMHVEPWRPDVRVGAVQRDGRLLVSLSAEQPWTGRLYFDRPRHREFLRLPVDYPRINQFPEWFTVTAERVYRIAEGAPEEQSREVTGRELLQGFPVELPIGGERRLVLHSTDTKASAVPAPRGVGGAASPPLGERSESKQPMSLRSQFRELVGEWSGKTSLWLTPTEPVRESETTASIQLEAGGAYATIRYHWTESGKPQHGLMVVRLAGAPGDVDVVWVDSWHMADKFMLCRGEPGEEAHIAALGSYAAPSGPDWGWRIVLTAKAPDEFVIRMYNLPPGHPGMLAVEAVYARKQ